VSALSYNDQGYFVPSANQLFAGTEFYTFAGYVGGWANTLHVMAYDDNTMVNITDSNTHASIWSGVLNAGEEYEHTTSSNIYYTILTDKDVTVAILPIDGWSSAYYHGTYVSDRTGSGIGTDFYTPSLDQYYGSSLLEVFAYGNGTQVNIYNAATQELMGTYSLDQGDFEDINPGYGYWHITSTNPISIYEGMDAASASFAPVLFGEAFGGYWTESRDALIEDVARFKLTVYNTGETDYDMINVSDVLPTGLIYGGGATVNGVPMEPTWVSGDGHRFAWVDPFVIHPGEWGVIEYNANVVYCGDLMNTGTATGYVSDVMVTVDDTASVIVPCEEEGVAPIIDITYPEDFDSFNYTDVGELTITGIAYDQDTYVDQVLVTLSYTDDDTFYYNASAGGWTLEPFYFTATGTGAGTMGDPLMWQLIIEPAFPVDYILYDVYAYVTDHDAIPLSNSDANYFYYPEPPAVNTAPYTPYDPDPVDGAVDVPLGNENVFWYGGDPDVGDSVTYDVYFSTDTLPTYRTTIGPYAYDLNPFAVDFGVPMTADTTYYWQIVAEDSHGAITEGPIWSFTTESELENIIGITLSTDTVNVGEDFTVTIYCDPTVAVGGWEIYSFLFDPALVQANSVSPGAEWTTNFDDGTINNTVGQITDIQSFKYDTYPEYNHTLCTISFTALAAGSSSFILDSVQVTDTSFLVDLLLDIRSADITINAE
jgi:uncharacterized repeat protein (TIGR01451 family)